jgi:VWFA-related protein
MKLHTSAVITACITFGAVSVLAQQAQEGGTFKFRTGVDLINVTATVSDSTGRFVSGLKKEDFQVYEDDHPQPITHFNSERVPVSLGIVLDTSGSMDGEKMAAARQALQRFVFDLLGPDDEFFLYRFDANPELVQGWTNDRQRIASALRRIQPRGGTAMYDAVAEAIPLAQTGRHRKKAIVLISDGNDTSSSTDIHALKAQIRETELLVYAIGIDAQAHSVPFFRNPFENLLNQASWQQGRPTPLPFPIPGRRTPPRGPGRPTPRGPFPPRYPVPPSNPRTGPLARLGDERVNVAALREITDDSGGRTELVRYARDLDPATAGIADELSKQYYIGYPATSEKDGRWHAIRLEVRNANYIVRARKGYVATP